MPILAAPPPPATGSRFRATRVRWTVDEFHKFACLPVFEGRKMILVDGEVLDMPPANHPHDMGIGKTNRTLGKVFPESAYWIRVQMALPLGQYTDPIPDVAVVEGEMTTHHRQPSTAQLLVEVSDSSLDYDTTDKADLYAAAGIADYWVLDLNGRQLFVFHNPVANSASDTGFRYTSIQTFDASATISPLAAPHAIFRVSDLLP